MAQHAAIELCRRTRVHMTAHLRVWVGWRDRRLAARGRGLVDVGRRVERLATEAEPTPGGRITLAYLRSQQRQVLRGRHLRWCKARALEQRQNWKVKGLSLFQ